MFPYHPMLKIQYLKHGPPQTPVVMGNQQASGRFKNLLPFVDDIPISVWLAALVGAAERFAWYGNTGPLQNYLQNSHDDGPLNGGGLGLSQAAASNIVSVFLAVSYFTPIPAAVIADSWLGRFKGLVISCIITLLGALILFISLIPQVIHTKAASGGVFAAMSPMSLGSGGVKTIVSPFIANQYVNKTPTVKVSKSGKFLVTDRALTIRFVYNAFNWLVNVGGLAALGTTFLERYVSFWAAYLGPLIVMFLSLLLLICWAARFEKEPPIGTVIPQAAKVVGHAIRSGFNMDGAKPGAQLQQYNREVPWNDRFVDELKIGLHACRILILFAIYWLCLNQTIHNWISQAGTMIGPGVPQRLHQVPEPHSNYHLYPNCRKHNLSIHNST